ncbi:MULTISPECIES: hypothetical protein [Micromonospora]|uniref:Uncharacterized protein n=2 Tax=Micromonospora TaxID=1873 RepID=A0A1C6RNX9_9ACTN|nr:MULTISPECIES: hypothetical protein [Micromonospora]TWJ31253.1 hypothetical protein JD81_04808 [Micromonospora sagamiensis]BCL15702.1 hypothetical protein GCM10017556_34410 [Micromonospora sagamiensis]SCL18916.1 hypothetical protein GA0074694_2509 [Micromonospora inyonensis]
MTDRTSQPDQVEVDTPRIPLSPTLPVSINGFGMDNVNRAETPSDLVAGPNEAGVKTEWDASSLDGAIRWLESHASYLRRLYHGMADIQDLMGGAGAAAATGMPSGVSGVQKSPLGGFTWAGRLTQKHANLYTGTESGVLDLANRLEDAVEVLRKVKENYQTAERANEMTAEQIRQIFADAASGGES